LNSANGTLRIAPIFSGAAWVSANTAATAGNNALTPVNDYFKAVDKADDKMHAVPMAAMTPSLPNSKPRTSTTRER